MTHSRTDSQLHVVIAGAGVAGLEAMIALRQLARDRVALTMLAPEREFVYKPLSVGDPFALGPALHTPVAEITLDLNADLIRDGLAAVDADAHNVTLTEGQKVPYD